MKTIEQTVRFAAPPAAVYEALIDSREHAAFTGEPAEISRDIGGAASFYGGKVTGINLHLEDGALIVQAWRPANLPPGVFTLVRYALAADGDGTKLTFTQTSVPDEMVEHLGKGWEERYWKPMREHFAKRAR